MGGDKEIESLKSDKIRAKSKKSWSEVAEICNYLGNKYSERGLLTEALTEHQEELLVCRDKLKDGAGVGLAYRCLGQVYCEMQDYKKSLESLKKYLESAENRKDYVEIQRALTTIGRTYFMKDDLVQAESAYSTSLKLAEKAKDRVKETEYIEMKCRCFLNLALVYDQKENLNEGCRYYSMAIQLATKHNLKETLHRCQNSLAQFYLKLKYHQRSVKLFNEAIATVKCIKNKVFECEYLLSKGHVLLLMNQPSEARRVFRRASLSKSPVDDDIQVAHEKLKKSTDVCKVLKAVKRHEEKKEPPDLRLLKMYDMLGDLFSELEVYPVAVDYYLKELEEAQKINRSSSELAPIHFSVAQTYLDDKNYEKALEYFKREIELRSGNPVEETRTTLKIIETQVAQGKGTEEICQWYEDALQKFSGDKRCLKRILKDYSIYLKQELEDQKAASVDQMLKDVGSDNDEDDDDTCHSDDDITSFDLDEVSSLSSGDSSENEESSSGILSASRPKRQKVKKMKTNELGETPLHKACIDGNHKEVIKLLEKGHPVNPRDHCGWLPIHEAANHGYADICLTLIENGAKINDPGGDKCGGTTPLHDACSNCQPKVIDVLLDRGADVTLMDNEGNTPIDCLRSWRTRVQDLDPDEEHIYKKLISRLEDRMKDAGFDVKAERKRPLIPLMMSTSPEPKNKRVAVSRRRQLDSPPSSPIRKKVTRERDLELDFSNPNVARSEYQSVITSLRRPKDNISGYPGTSRSKTTISSLLPEDEAINDWLDDDLCIRDSKSVHDLYTSSNLPHKNRMSSKKPKEKTTCDDSRDDPKIISKNYKRNASRVTVDNNFTDDYDDDDDEPVIISRVEEPNVIRIEDKNHIQKKKSESKSCKDEKKILIKVRFEDSKCFLLKVPTVNHKIEWIIQETVERYFEMEKKKPIIYLATGDGAILSPHDLISDVVTEGEVHAKIRSFESLSLDLKYSQNCKRCKMKPIVDLEVVLSTAESSGILNLSHVMIPMAHVSVLLDSIESSERIICADFSFTDLTLNLGSDGKKRMIQHILPSLVNLKEVRFRGSGMREEDVVSLTDTNLKITLLDLSYNSLGDSCFKRLILSSSSSFSDTSSHATRHDVDDDDTPCTTDVPLLLSSFPSLNTLEIIGCDLSCNILWDEKIRGSLTRHEALHSIIVMEDDGADDRRHEDERESQEVVGWKKRHKWKKMRRVNITRQKGVTPQVPSLFSS